MMKTHLSLKQLLAVEIERATNPATEHWDDQQLHAWCFDDQFGGKYFARNLTVADHLINKFDIKERDNGTADYQRAN
jgi:hypothetical protein